MDWLLLSITAYILYAFNNVNVRGFIKNNLGNGRNYLIFFGLIWFVFLVSIGILSGLVVPAPHLLVVLAFNGLLTALSLYFLFVSVSKDDVYRVAVLLSLSPVFTALFSHFFLGERFYGQEFWGILLLVFAGVLASISKDSVGNWKTSAAVVYALSASVFMAASNVIFKYATIYLTPVSVLMWGRIFAALLIVLLLVVPKWRQDFISRVVGDLGLIALLGANEFIALVGTLLFVYAIASSTATLVAVVSAVYPIFAFVFGAIYTFVKPEFLTEDLRPHSVVLKLTSLALLISGLLFIS